MDKFTPEEVDAAASETESIRVYCGDFNVADMLRAFAARLREDKRVTVPDGWKLVPVAPTDAMKCAGFESDAWDQLVDDLIDAHRWTYSCRQSADCVAGIYAAMISAAPAAICEEDAMNIKVSLSESYIAKWKDRYLQRLVEKGVEPILALSAFLGTEDEHDYNSDPVEAADFDLSYWEDCRKAEKY